MLVRLTGNVFEANNIKTTVRENRGQVILWVKGAVIEMSDASGQKYIDAGNAESLTEEEEAEEREFMAEEAETRRVERKSREAEDRRLLAEAKAAKAKEAAG